MLNDDQKSLLLSELRQLGVKHYPDRILKIAKKNDGTIIFLETGNSLSGLQHILENHSSDFLERGISKDQIPELIIDAVVFGKVVGIQGRGRTIYEIMFKSELQYVSVTVAENGYVVGANPTPKRLIKKLN